MTGAACSHAAPQLQSWSVHLQFLEKAKEDSVKPKDGVEGDDEMEEREQEDGPSYQFNNQEATVVEVVMDSMRICALALAVQFASTFLLGGY